MIFFDMNQSQWNSAWEIGEMEETQVNYNGNRKNIQF